MSTNIFITLDYELFFGVRTGSLEKSIIIPTTRIIQLLDKYNIKASFFVDSGYLVNLKKQKNHHKLLNQHYNRIITQITHLSDSGHDIQLHIHPHWKDSYFDGDKWIINTSRYRLHDFREDEIENIVHTYKNALTELIGEKIFAFRAGGWCIQPFDKIMMALKNNNIWLDSTLYSQGFISSQTHYFDFRDIPNKTSWKFSQDPKIEDKNGFFTEIPISSYKLSPLFFWKMALFRKFGGQTHKSFGDGSAIGGSQSDKARMLLRYTHNVASIDGYKSVYLQSAFDEFTNNDDHRNFVIMGHPKASSVFSLQNLEKFILKNIKNNFTTFSNTFTGR